MADGLGFNWVGLKEVQAAVVNVGKQVDAAAAANVREASMRLVRDAKNNFSGSHKRGEPHVGGSRPNVVSGDLRRSIMTDSIAHLGMGLYSTKVGPTMVYARRVELGMPGHGGAYPYFGPAAAKLRTEMAAIATANWIKYLKL